ncbi:DNA alkylation repair protein [Lysobacter enzymogenes]|uniref:DNA alkylation repair protein n=1 Tax=Lysobacter enzymogenes TaxID=69 RepID=UPI0008987E92|nr:DNA alkylation repair protein [Lysobacter enzymogenes]SDX93614.1 3-methyladenine DNA glycosylase AlkD [Lysobacter enzymogenes]
MARTATTEAIARAAGKKAATKKVAAKKSPAKKVAAKLAPKPSSPAGERKAAQAAFAALPLPQRLAQALDALRASASAEYRDGMARFAIPNERAFGVPMAKIQAVAKRLGRDHALAEALWDTGWYEARLLAAYVDDPAAVTAAQMDRWARDFDNWAVCDTVCFALFDRSPLAWRKIEQWAKREDEFVRRAAFALLASKSVHDKLAGDAEFLRGLELVEAYAFDERNFVKKAVNWALRSVGKRNAALHAAALRTATRLAASAQAAPRWNGKDALRELNGAATMRRLSRKD